MTAQTPSYEERMKWFHEARFGMFIHWGLYSLLGRGEWAMYVERTPPEEYAPLAKRFNPRRFDPDVWMSLAREAGMKYVVLTTRHHDGFCLFDSKVSSYTAPKTAAGRDLVAEYVAAARRAGMKIGFYYSWLDWRFAGYHDYKAHPASVKAMVQQAHQQIRELMTGYGKIDLLWYDGHWVPGLPEAEVADFWGAREVNAEVRRLQPHILINNRCGLKEDLDTPEQHVTSSEPGRGWESCMTMGDSCGWGYMARNPNFKTVPQLLQYLATAAAGEGNYLLNIGPKPDGTIRREEVARLKAMGAWMAKNSESIRGSQRCPFNNGLLGVTTANGNTAYQHVFHWPAQGEICIPGIRNRVKRATILSTGQEGRVVTAGNNRTFIKDLPRTPPDPCNTVVKLELDGKPEAC